MDSKKRLWIYTGLALVAGVGLVTSYGSSPPSPAPPAPARRLGPGARLLLVGDSLAQGLSMPMRQIAGEGKVLFASDARIGTRIDQWAHEPWLAAAIAAFHPTLVLVSLGTNDMKLADPATSQKPPLAKVLATLRGSGAEPAWIVPPAMPFPDRGVRKLLEAAGIPLFRSDNLTIPRAPDRIHPTVAGYAGWAGSLWKWADAPPRALSGIPGHRPRRVMRRAR